MKTELIFRKTLLAASIAMITACGGGSTSSVSTDGTTMGVITGFGSIYVNGVEYETDGASVDIDGVSSSEANLRVGDVVVLKGSVNADGLTGVASAVSSTDELEGYVVDVSGLATGSLVVMGQTVKFTADTIFESNTRATILDLLVTDIVEVHGFSGANGEVYATRIETKNAAEDIEVKGVVSAIDPAQSTFMLGSLKVDYQNASGGVPGNLGNGLYVEVKADLAPTGDIINGFVLAATKVEVEDDGDRGIGGNEGDELEVQGYVTAVTATSFDFNGQTVPFASLDIDDDFDPATLVVGMMITVEGYIDASGNFVVKEVEESHASELEVQGTVGSKGQDTVTIAGATYTVNNNTRILDEQDQGMVPVHYFSLADVQTGDYLEIDYYVDTASGLKIATKLVREDQPL